MTVDSCAVLLEDGTELLAENSDVILLEDCVSTTAPTATASPGGTNYEINPETRRFWESERQRLQILRDDEEVLLLVVA